MELVDEILDALRNGEWHEFGAIIKEQRLSQTKVELILNFLAKYHFVKLSKKHQMVKLPTEVMKFLEELQQIEENENKKSQTKWLGEPEILPRT